MKLAHFLTPYTKINSKWIKDLNVRPETIKLLEESIGRTLDDINQSKILYDPPPRVMEIKTKLNKWDLIKHKIFCTAKEIISKVKRQPSEWEKITANEATDKQLISRIYKGKKSFFNKRCWENWTPTRKRIKLECSLTPYTKINSKWIKNLNVSLDNLKLLEENVGRILFEIN